MRATVDVCIHIVNTARLEKINSKHVRFPNFRPNPSTADNLIQTALRVKTSTRRDERATRQPSRVASSSSLKSSRRGPYSVTPECPRVTARLHGQQAVYCCPCTAELVKPPVPRAAWTSPPTRVMEGDREADLCGTARLGGHVCPLEVWLHVQRVSCVDGRLDPAHDRDLSERKRLCSSHGSANGSRLFDVGVSCGRLQAFFQPRHTAPPINVFDI